VNVFLGPNVHVHLCTWHWLSQDIGSHLSGVNKSKIPEEIREKLVFARNEQSFDLAWHEMQLRLSEAEISYLEQTWIIVKHHWARYKRGHEFSIIHSRFFSSHVGHGQINGSPAVT
jgi:hypothetical protein